MTRDKRFYFNFLSDCYRKNLVYTMDSIRKEHPRYYRDWLKTYFNVDKNGQLFIPFNLV